MAYREETVASRSACAAAVRMASNTRPKTKKGGLRGGSPTCTSNNALSAYKEDCAQRGGGRGGDVWGRAGGRHRGHNDVSRRCNCRQSQGCSWVAQTNQSGAGHHVAIQHLFWAAKSPAGCDHLCCCERGCLPPPVVPHRVVPVRVRAAPPPHGVLHGRHMLGMHIGCTVRWTRARRYNLRIPSATVGNCCIWKVQIVSTSHNVPSKHGRGDR